MAIRNVLLLTIDALRQDKVGCYGSKSAVTPNLDRLAATGARFTQAIAIGGWTRPALTGMLTSTYPSMFGGSWGKLDSSRPYLPELLGQNGIRTAALIANPQVGALYGFERGFDIFEEPQPTYPGPKWAYLPGMQRLLSRPYPHALLGLFGVKTAPPAVTATAAELTDRLLELISGSASPQFIWVHYMDVHWPYHVSQELKGARDTAQAWRDLRVMHETSEKRGWYHPGAERLMEVQAAYDQAVTYVDTQLGRLLDGLERMSLKDCTSLIVTADHGEEFFEHNRWGHYQLYDENIRVPLLVHLPGGLPGISIHHQVSLLDLAPTILDLMDTDVPGEMLGQSWLPAFHDLGGHLGHSEAYVESMWSDSYRLAIRTAEHKVLYDSKLPDERRLYNLAKDPAEKVNLWTVDPEMAARFEVLLSAHQAYVAASNQGTLEEEIKLDQFMVERLRALGYMD